MRKILLFFFVLFAQQYAAQTPGIWLALSDTSFRNCNSLLSFDSRTFYNSNSINNGFVKKFVLGGHISDHEIDHISDQLANSNRAGALQQSGFAFFNFKDTMLNRPHLGLSVYASQFNDVHLSFTDELFNTVFIGNKMYRGKTAALAPLAFQYLAFQKIGVGLFDKRNFSSISLSYINGQNFMQLQMDQADLFTSEGGDSLSLVYKGEYWRSDTSRSGFMVANGQGLALDLNLNMTLAENSGLISLSIQNVGFISWNKNFEKFTADSLQTWTGLEVNDLFELDSDSLSFPNVQDSLLNKPRKESEVTELPSSVNIRFINTCRQHDFYEIGLSVQPNRSSLPTLHSSYTAALGRGHYFTLRLLYGGYGNFRVGWTYEKLLMSSWYFRLGTDDWPGVFSKAARGQSAFISIAKTFGKNNVTNTR